MWAKHILSGYKPIFVYTNGKPIEKPWIASVHSDTMDKVFHEWGQGVGFSMKIIEMFTLAGATILEPFLGGGTVLKAAKELGRKAIGIEIEEKYCEIAVRRLQQDMFQWDSKP